MTRTRHLALRVLVCWPLGHADQTANLRRSLVRQEEVLREVVCSRCQRRRWLRE